MCMSVVFTLIFNVTMCHPVQELNELALGSDFNLDERYAQMYAAVFVCLAYSLGVPLLVPVLCVTMVSGRGVCH